MKRLLLIIILVFPLSCYDGLSDMVDDVTMKVPVCVWDAAPGPVHDGRGWKNAYLTLADAVAGADECDTIWVAGPQEVTATITISKPLTILGGFSGVESRRDQRAVDSHAVVNYLPGDSEAVIISSQKVVFDTIRIQNVNSVDGAVTISGGSSVIFENCLFYNNQATSDSGGAISLGNADLRISNCIFDGNKTASAPNVGGAINALNNSKVIISDSEFYRNSATSTGGAIYADASTVTITGSLFGDEDAAGSGNSAIGKGGAIYAAGSSRMIISGSTFYGNSSGSDGGVIHLHGCAADIYDSDFINNQSNSSGGVLDIYGWNAVNDVSILRCSFKNNTAQGDRGGAILCNGSDMVIYDSFFQSNTLSGFTLQSGGAGICIMNIGDEPVKIVNTMFYGNSASGTAAGGAIGVGIVASAAAKILNCTFYMNEASDSNGGAVAVGVNNTVSTVNIYNSLFYGNTDSSGPSSIHRFNGTLNTCKNYWDVIPTGTYNSNGDLAASSFDPFVSVNSGESDFLYLSSGSACIDAGTSDLTAIGMTLPLTDLAGNPRIAGGTIDIGAYERQ